MPDVAKRMMALFAGHPEAHGTYGEPTKGTGPKQEIKSTARTYRSAATEQHWSDHLSGKYALGIVPIRPDNMCGWGSIDIDQYEIDLSKITELIDTRKLPLIPCRSKSGGMHLFIFLDPPQKAASVITLLRKFEEILGLANCEIFPKQANLSDERGDIGNWIAMPYFGSTFDGKIKEQVALNKNGNDLTVEEFLALADELRLDNEKFSALLLKRDKSKKTKVNKQANGAWFTDGPPCLETLSENGFPEGGRNNALLMIGIYLKRKGDDWEQKLDEANFKFMTPPLGSSEVSAVVRSLKRKNYEYTCKTTPMCDYCNSATCKKRPLGISGGDDNENYPAITSISKLDVTPPLWYVDIDGQTLILKTEQLLNYNLFLIACVEKTNECYSPLRAKDWHKEIAAALKNVNIVEAPKEVGEEGQFLELLEKYLTNRIRGKIRDELLEGKPWENEKENRHYFRLEDLCKFITQEGFRIWGRNRISAQIKELGGASHTLSIKNTDHRFWWVPSSLFQQRPTLDTPPSKDVPI